MFARCLAFALLLPRIPVQGLVEAGYGLSSSSLRVISRIAVRPGDAIQITGIPVGNENASLNYVKIREAQNE